MHFDSLCNVCRLRFPIIHRNFRLHLRAPLQIGRLYKCNFFLCAWVKQRRHPLVRFVPNAFDDDSAKLCVTTICLADSIPIPSMPTNFTQFCHTESELFSIDSFSCTGQQRDLCDEKRFSRCMHTRITMLFTQFTFVGIVHRIILMHLVWQSISNDRRPKRKEKTHVNEDKQKKPKIGNRTQCIMTVEICSCDGSVFYGLT